MSDEMVVLSGTDENGNPVELIAQAETPVSVRVCRSCRTPLHDDSCPKGCWWW